MKGIKIFKKDPPKEIIKPDLNRIIQSPSKISKLNPTKNLHKEGQIKKE